MPSTREHRKNPSPGRVLSTITANKGSLLFSDVTASLSKLNIASFVLSQVMQSPSNSVQMSMDFRKAVSSASKSMALEATRLSTLLRLMEANAASYANNFECPSLIFTPSGLKTLSAGSDGQTKKSRKR